MWGVSEGEKLRKNGGHEKDGGGKNRKRQHIILEDAIFPPLPSPLLYWVMARMEESYNLCEEAHLTGLYVDYSILVSFV